MPDFELRLVEGFHQGPKRMNIIQGRCSDMYEWGAICSNTPADFPSLKTGRVACHELGFADHAVETGISAFDEVDVNHRPNYTLSVDIGCVGNESSISTCQHLTLRECTNYATVECFTSKCNIYIKGS